MDDERWQRLWQIFHDTLERPAAERSAHLDAACDDAEMRREVEELLAAHEGTTNPLDRPPAAGAAGAGAGPRRLGPYEIVRELGSGGMGTVYLAQRRDRQFEQQVAVKVVRRGMDSEEIVARFRQERQILARLEHPNVARLYDGGTTEEGLPYFVMEHVEGEPIDRYCEGRGLAVEERLALVRVVCSAVQYAHRNLVVHRDLKPNNVLVTPDGVPKLLDFGIAKLLDPASRELATTRLGERPLTPEYASPEQVRGEAITTASDVYSLGVLLFRLLTGRPPYRLEGAGWREVERIVCEQRPERPSTAAVRGAEHPEATRKLRRRLRGDLDNIVLRALEKDPARRYASVEQLEEDLRRYAEGLPVMARPAGLGYRLGKFVRRHRAAAVTAALVLLLVAGFTASSIRQAAATAGALERAELELRKSERVLELLLQQLRFADPYYVYGETVTARQMFEHAATRLQEDRGDPPEVRAAVLAVVGKVQANMGLTEEATAVLEESLALRRQIFGEHHPEVAESLHELARARQGAGQHEVAEELEQQALALRRQLLGEQHRKVADSLVALGSFLQDQGSYEAAEERFREALAIVRPQAGEDDQLLANCLALLGDVLTRRGEYEGAEAALNEALELRLRHYGEEAPNVAYVIAALGTLHAQRGNYAEAESFYRRSLVLNRKFLGEAHPRSITTLMSLAIMVYRRGDSVAAEPLLREAIELQRARGEHRRLGDSLSALGLALRDQGRSRQAEVALREALALYRRVLGDSHVQVSVGLNNLALLLRDRGDNADAEPLYREALAIHRQALGSDHPDLAFPLTNLARLLHERGELEEAEALLREGLELRRRKVPDHPSLATSLVWLGNLLIDRGGAAAAEPLLREAVEIRRRAYGEGSWRAAESEGVLGRCLAALGEAEDAERLLLASHGVIAEQKGDDDPRSRAARQRLADFYRAQGRPEDAERFRASAAPALRPLRDAREPAEISAHAAEISANRRRGHHRPGGAPNPGAPCQTGGTRPAGLG